MRKNVILFLFVCVSVLLIVCCRETPTQLDKLEDTGTQNLEKSVTVLEVDLVAEWDKIIGTVSVEGGQNKIVVTYNITDPVWCLNETNLQIGEKLSDIPQNANGVPIPGFFDYKYKITDDECIHTFSFRSINEWRCGDDIDLIIGAHALVTNSITSEVVCAWGASEPILLFNDKTPAAYFVFEFECPVPGGRKMQIKM